MSWGIELGQLFIDFGRFVLLIGLHFEVIFVLFLHIFSSIFRHRFWRRLGRILEPKRSPMGDQNVYFLDPGARRGAKRRKCDFHDPCTYNHAFYLVTGTHFGQEASKRLSKCTYDFSFVFSRFLIDFLTILSSKKSSKLALKIHLKRGRKKGCFQVVNGV